MPQSAPPDASSAITAFNHKNFRECEEISRALLAAHPDHPGLMRLLGLAVAEQNRLDEAIGFLVAARTASPGDPAIRLDLGLIQAAAGQDEQALAELEEAHRLAPADPSVLLNIATLHQARGDWKTASELYRRVIRLTPDDPIAHGNLGACLLGLNRWDEGFREYEHRLKQAQIRRTPSPAPVWPIDAPTDGTLPRISLSGKTLLVTAEQGYGDMIQFSRFLPALAQRGAKQIIVECHPGLESLISTLPGVSQTVTMGSPLPNADYQVSMISLGRHLGFAAGQVPPYLGTAFADMQSATPPQPGHRLRVGLVWTGRPVNGTPFQRRQHGLRHCPIEALAPICHLPFVDRVSLQQSWASPQLAESGFPILDMGPHLTDFMATAALIANLDLVISIDSAVAHLAGAMGKPVWLLLGPGQHDYRWGEVEAGRSPWYPQTRVFRCGPNGWDALMDEVAEALLFHRAFTAHQSGDVDMAEHLYNDVLARNPSHPLALCNRGQIAAETGRQDDAEHMYRAALAGGSNLPEAWNNLGALLQDQEKLDEAEEAFRHAIAGRPGFAAAWSNLGNALRLQDKTEEAAEAYQTAIRLDPNHVQAYCGLGNALKILLRFPEADEAYQQALARKPDYAEALINRAGGLLMMRRLEEAMAATIAALSIRPNFPEAEGTIRLVLMELGIALMEHQELDQAEQLFRLAVARYPDDPETRFRLANVFLRRRWWEQAEETYRQVLVMDPNFAPAWNNLCSLYLEKDDGTKALAAVEKALELESQLADIHNNHGNALRACGRTQDSLAAFGKALALRPEFPEAFNNLGVVMGELAMVEGSLAAFDQALTLRPNYAEAYSNRGNVLKSNRRGEEAIESYGKALELRPDYHGARLNRAIALLQQGRWIEGWEEYRCRWLTGPLARQRVAFLKPEWEGEPLDGKTILFYGEQGYGDVLHFIRYAPMLKQRGGRVIAVVHKGLVRLFQSAPGVDEVRAFDDPPPEFDAHLAMMSAPRIFATTPETIPASIPYLTADPQQVAQWKNRLTELPGRKVGLVWSGDPRPHDLSAHILDKQRSLPLSAFAGFADIPGLSWVSLQKGSPAAQASQAPFPLFNPMDEISDFADTAALVSALDLVVSVDTSMVHLTGALGCPVWILSRYDGCWRWLRDREDSPWYPSARLFHQTAPNDWSETLDQLKAALSVYAAQAS